VHHAVAQVDLGGVNIGAIASGLMDASSGFVAARRRVADERSQPIGWFQLALFWYTISNSPILKI
jgi:hypothetical protein